MTQMLAPAKSAWFADFAGFTGVVEITRVNTSEFLYYLDELHGNKLVFTFSFVPSNNTDVETHGQQFHTASGST